MKTLFLVVVALLAMAVPANACDTPLSATLVESKCLPNGDTRVRVDIANTADRYKNSNFWFYPSDGGITYGDVMIADDYTYRLTKDINPETSVKVYIYANTGQRHLLLKTTVKAKRCDRLHYSHQW